MGKTQRGTVTGTMQARLKARAKAIAKRLAGSAGFELRRVRSRSQQVPVGDMRAVLGLLAARFEPGLVFDVGAFRGDVAVMMHETFGCPVVMVEPLTEMAPYLHRLTADSAYTWVQAAVSSDSGPADIYVDLTTLDGTSLAEHKGPARRVEVTTLDDMAEKYGSPGLVKIDVQGHELAVLAGASTLLGRTEAFILEVLFPPHAGLTEFAEVVAVMADRGYVVWDFAGFARRPMDGVLFQADVVFVREDGPLRPAGWG